MLTAVDLDDQPTLRAKEIDDVVPDRRLPTEAAALDAAPA
jgi:hypothetical protein